MNGIRTKENGATSQAKEISTKGGVYLCGIGFGIAILVFGISNAQFEDHYGATERAIEQELNRVALGEESTGSISNQQKGSGVELKQSRIEKDRPIAKPKETGGMQKIENEVGELVKVRGFADGGLASIVSTKARNYSKDKGFLILLRCENATYDLNRKSFSVGANGFYDYGLCQVNEGYHPEIVGNDLFFKSLDYQIEQCYKLYKSGTPFYGPSRINKKTGKTCSETVKIDFTIVGK